jgi:hypothetical protein
LRYGLLEIDEASMAMIASTMGVTEDAIKVDSSPDPARMGAKS